MSNQAIRFIKHNWMPLSIIMLGLATRFAFVWWPPEIVFDEVHSGKFVASYFTGEYIFDIHPPLGKLLTALALWFADFKPGFDFANIGENYGSVPYIALRFFPNLFGGLLPLAAWWLARELNFSKLSAFSAGLLLVLDGALITHTHFAMLDAFMLFFGFAGLAAFLRARNKEHSATWLTLAGLLLGLSVSSKWVGITFISAVGVLVIWDTFARLISHRNNFVRGRYYIPAVKSLLALAVLPLAVYILTFAVYFRLNAKPGAGNAFMSANFLSKGLYGKFAELNKVMYTVNAANLTPHSYSSKPYTWPIMTRSIFYWIKSGENSTTARIYLLGNPAVWWGSTLFGALALLFWWPRENKAKKWLLVWLWFISMAPFLLVARTLFLYHYFTALVAAVLLAVGWLGDEPYKKVKICILGAIIVGAVTLFFFFAPLTYGFFMTEEAYKLRLWFPTWQ